MRSPAQTPVPMPVGTQPTQVPGLSRTPSSALARRVTDGRRCVPEGGGSENKALPFFSTQLSIKKSRAPQETCRRNPPLREGWAGRG